MVQYFKYHCLKDQSQSQLCTGSSILYVSVHPTSAFQATHIYFMHIGSHQPSHVRTTAIALLGCLLFPV